MEFRLICERTTVPPLARTVSTSVLSFHNPHVVDVEVIIDVATDTHDDVRIGVDLPARDDLRTFYAVGVGRELDVSAREKLRVVEVHVSREVDAARRNDLGRAPPGAQLSSTPNWTFA